MAHKSVILKEDEIKNKIHTIRGLQIMLDSDLAELYEIETKVLNQAVNRNYERFPERFMFQLTKDEFENLMSQFVTSSSGWGGKRKLPYVFTEQGVAMLSGILKSSIAVKISIQIMDAFVAMRKFIANNAQIFHRLDFIEEKQLEHDRKFEAIFSAIEDKSLHKKQGIFFDGQIFDAYRFVSDLIRSAEKSIILIDSYIDDSVLTLFAKRKENVSVVIYTANIKKELMLDITKYNSQYPQIEIKEFKQSHDRFLIIDEANVYHFGASLKDLGKKWFAFSKFDKEAFNLLDKLGLK